MRERLKSRPYDKPPHSHADTHTAFRAVQSMIGATASYAPPTPSAPSLPSLLSFLSVARRYHLVIQPKKHTIRHTFHH